MRTKLLDSVIEQTEDLIRQAQQLRSDLSESERAEALRIGRLSYASAGAVRQK